MRVIYVAKTANTDQYSDTDKRAMSDHPPANSSTSTTEEADMDHLADITESFHDGSVSVDQSDSELDIAEPMLRLETLASIFAAESVPLKNFDVPPQCYEYPDQAEEIFSLYLFRTVFLVKVWISFDAADNVFFEGARSAACGNLRLPEGVYQELASIDPDIHVFKPQHVRFEVGTPFRTLAVVEVNVEHSYNGAKLRASSEMAPGHAYKDRLKSYVQRCCRRIEHLGLVYGVDCLAFKDLENFASLFRCDRRFGPERDEDWEQPRYWGGEWAGVEDPHESEVTFNDTRSPWFYST